jgi:hypothetical protein
VFYYGNVTLVMASQPGISVTSHAVTLSAHLHDLQRLHFAGIGTQCPELAAWGSLEVERVTPEHKDGKDHEG